MLADKTCSWSLYYRRALSVSLGLRLICDTQRVSLQVLRGVTSWHFRFCEVIRSERRITTLIWVSQSDTRFTIVTLVAVVVVRFASFLSRVC